MNGEPFENSSNHTFFSLYLRKLKAKFRFMLIKLIIHALEKLYFLTFILFSSPPSKAKLSNDLNLTSLEKCFNDWSQCHNLKFEDPLIEHFKIGTFILLFSVKWKHFHQSIKICFCRTS